MEEVLRWIVCRLVCGVACSLVLKEALLVEMFAVAVEERLEIEANAQVSRSYVYLVTRRRRDLQSCGCGYAIVV